MKPPLQYENTQNRRNCVNFRISSLIANYSSKHNLREVAGTTDDESESTYHHMAIKFLPWIGLGNLDCPPATQITSHTFAWERFVARQT